MLLYQACGDPELRARAAMLVPELAHVGLGAAPVEEPEQFQMTAIDVDRRAQLGTAEVTCSPGELRRYMEELAGHYPGSHSVRVVSTGAAGQRAADLMFLNPREGAE